MGPLTPHGKLLIIDESRAILGSMAMSALSLDFRREVSVLIEQKTAVAALSDFYAALVERVGDASSSLPGDAAA
jgi:phosphatidylserine/phosphatidylglycerophosphate/cardiolipin synthase-like enzyme